ncbi:Nramp family divalent metal transporter [[Clostridium] fimetarium]|uniref:Manganese transport protein n=1 Tax=[Clostridium] fimetarium TaxID=99656 RepID=A0A1I0PIY2_9FIRM|nr:Nramp family divalent metal transporter [[Clostridium] fimetarium]SEW14192.1 manganese transport protein [[Clostridium] fimetarium]
MKSFRNRHKPGHKASDFFKYLGPGLLVTVGFIDPGNWVSNLAAGSSYGYVLLWMVTVSTIMLIVLQHNAAHLGIVTGKCLSEATTENIRPWIKNIILLSAVAASISTAMAEILGGAIALNMLFRLPLQIGAIIILVVVLLLQFTNSYKRIEKIIIGFVSIIGLSFLFEICVVHINWGSAMTGWVTPSFPLGSMPVIMSVLGAVVMPHNLFLHSEIIQSHQFNLQDDAIIQKELKHEFTDTLFSMIVGWAINSAMILLAAATFFEHGTVITDLSQAQGMLKPLLGSAASIIFAVALLFAGLSSSITAGMAGGSIFAGIFAKPYDITERHTKAGILITMVPAALIILFITSPFQVLIYSQMLLSIQLPITIFTLIYLTSSKKVMHKYVNSKLDKIFLWSIGIIVTGLNIALLVSYL